MWARVTSVGLKVDIQKNYLLTMDSAIGPKSKSSASPVRFPICMGTPASPT